MTKSKKEITREYEDEKWGPLLARVRASIEPVTVADVDEWGFQDVSPSLCSIGDDFTLMTPIEGRRFYVNLVARVLEPYAPASALVELGAGYGARYCR